MDDQNPDGHIRTYKGGQLKRVIDKIVECPGTRQATVGLYLPEDVHSSDPPCMAIIDFKLRNDGLRTFAWFRSNDMVNAYPINYYGLLFISQYIINQLNLESNWKVKLARITTRSESAHVYRWD